MSRKTKWDEWMPFYIGHYLRDTSRLTTEQHGAYLLLIMDYWVNGPLPDDDTALASISKLQANAWILVRPVLQRYFIIADGEWRHKRVEEERLIAKNISAERSAAGKAGAEAKAAKRQQAESKPEAIASAKGVANDKQDATPLPIPLPNKKDSPPDGFEEFWEVYPRKVARGQAVKAFKTAIKKADAATIKAGAIRYAASVSGKEPHWMAHPATWLNGERWLDHGDDIAPADRPPNPDAKRRVDEGYARLIKKRIPIGATFSIQKARELVASGLVTAEECSNAGYPV